MVIFQQLFLLTLQHLCSCGKISSCLFRWCFLGTLLLPLAVFWQPFCCSSRMSCSYLKRITSTNVTFEMEKRNVKKKAWGTSMHSPAVVCDICAIVKTRQRRINFLEAQRKCRQNTHLRDTAALSNKLNFHLKFAFNLLKVCPCPVGVYFCLVSFMLLKNVSMPTSPTGHFVQPRGVKWAIWKKSCKNYKCS